MKKVVTILVFVLLIFSIASFAFAQVDTDNSGSGSGDDNSTEDDSDSSGDDDEETEEGEDRNRERSEIRERARNGEFESEIRREIRNSDGDRVRIERKIKIKDGETEIRTRLKVRGNGANFSIVDSEGEMHKVRVTPQRMRSLLIERLQADNITEFSIEEIEHQNVPRVVFKANSEHPGRFLGIFKLSMKAETQIDSETGEIVDVNVPWWAFLVSGEQINNDIVGNETLEDDLVADDEELEEEFEDIEVDEELEIKAETLNGNSEIKIELKFETDVRDTDSVIDEVLGKLTLTSEKIDEFLRVETSDEALEDEEKLEFEIDSDEDEMTEVEFELKYFTENDSRESIVNSISDKLSSLDSESLSSVLEVDTDEEEEDDEEGETADEITVELEEENDSGESGTAELEEEDGQVTVTVSMAGFTQDVSQPAHIHTGECPEVGGIVYPLENVLNGESVTVLDVTLEQLEGELPLGINIHKSVEEASIYTACGDLEFE